MEPSGSGRRNEGVDTVPGGARFRVRQRVVPAIKLDELERVEIRPLGESDLSRPGRCYCPYAVATRSLKSACIGRQPATA